MDDNAVEEIQQQIGVNNCLCPRFTAKYIETVDDTPTRKVAEGLD
jgi:hypothetical protein